MPASGVTAILLSPSFPNEAVNRVRAASPDAQIIHLTDLHELPEGAAAAEILAWWDGDRAALTTLAQKLPALRWVQSNVAGVGDQRLHEVLPPGTTLTGAAGVYADLVAEHALALILSLYRRLPELLEQQHRQVWHNLEARTLAGQTLGVIGAGGIGRAAARMARAFGMHTIGIRRGTGALPEFDQLLPSEELAELLRRADVVLVAAPLTAATRGMIDGAALDRMRRSALLVNVARGPLVVTEALMDVLRRGRIAGAGLDVTDPEPLPPDHPLWALPTVIITPHQANPDAPSGGLAAARFVENLRRFRAGTPLLAVVDPDRGY